MNYMELEEGAERQPLDLIEAHNGLTGTMIFALALPSDHQGRHTAAEENSNHSHLEQVWVILYVQPSDPVAVKQVDTVPGIFRKTSGTFKHDLRQEREKRIEHWKHLHLATPNMLADDLEEAGILLGEVYDEKIIGELLAQEEESYSG